MKLAKSIGRLGTETAFEVLAKAKKLEAQGKDIVHLEIGEPDFETPDHIKEAAKKALDDNFTHYVPSPGLMEVREVIAEHQSDVHNKNISPENVVFTPGAKPIMFFTIMALIEPGDEVIYPNPGFPIYESMINYVGGKAVPMELKEEKGFNADVDLIEQSISDKTKLIYVSTDQVYGDTEDYSETNQLLKPVNNYGKSKLFGEQKLQNISSNYLILRTNIFGWNVKRARVSSAEWMYFTMKQGKEINLFTLLPQFILILLLI